jgi:tripartite-type tricarboxylate transporter receptor subunit TctC
MGLKEPNDPAWYGLVAPAGTPDDVINKLNAAVVKALQDKAFVQRLQRLAPNRRAIRRRSTPPKSRRNSTR